MLMALALDNVPDAVARAVDHAEKSKAILLLKLEHLNGLADAQTDTDRKEIVDITELMVDVDNKVRSSKSEMERLFH